MTREERKAAGLREDREYLSAHITSVSPDEQRPMRDFIVNGKSFRELAEEYCRRL